MTEELHRFYFTKYSDVDEFTKELSGYIEDLISAQKEELLDNVSKIIEEEKERIFNSNDFYSGDKQSIFETLIRVGAKIKSSLK